MRYAQGDDALEKQLGYYMVMIGGSEIYNGAVAIFLWGTKNWIKFMHAVWDPLSLEWLHDTSLYMYL